MDRPTTAYRIAKWGEVFETADSRKYKSVQWVAIPIAFDSNGYQMMIDDFGDRAPAIYGAWCAMIQIAARSPTRGLLAASNGIGYSAGRLARLAHFPVEVFDQLIDWAARPEIGWLEEVSTESLALRGEEDRSVARDNEAEDTENADAPRQSPGDLPVISRQSPGTPGDSPGDLPEPPEITGKKTGLQNRTVHNSTEQNRERAPTGDDSASAVAGGRSIGRSVDPDLLDWLEWWNSLRRSDPPMVPCGASVDPPSQAVAKAWRAVLRDRDLRRMIDDTDGIEREIRQSSMVRESGWFRPEKLLAGRNRDGEFIVRKLLEGGYRDSPRASAAALGPGQMFIPDASFGDGF